MTIGDMAFRDGLGNKQSRGCAEYVSDFVWGMKDPNDSDASKQLACV